MDPDLTEDPDFDEEWYLSRYPDVAAAIAAGKVRSALAHYRSHGVAEKRQPIPSPADKDKVISRPQYQTFPGEKGDSESEAKFSRLRISAFEGKSVLDVGCNEGFFCFKAAAGGATRVLGIDRDPLFIARAKSRRAHSGLRQGVVEFRCQSWDRLPDEKFDIIFFLSAMHYAEDQAALLKSLVERLTPSGVLVLECGVIEGDHRDFVKVRRSIDEVQFPTLGKISEILEAYAWKRIGSSVDQGGDPVPRLVFHIRRLKPTIILLLGNSYSGKTTLARLLQKSGIPCIMIDNHVRVRAKQADTDPRLADVIAQHYDGERLDQLYAKLRQEGLFQVLLDDIIQSLNKTSAPVSVVEGAVGADPALRRSVVKTLEERGYFVWLADSGVDLLDLGRKRK